MDENLKFIQEFVEKYNNTLVLDIHDVVVLRGYSTDPQDHYWVIQDMKGNMSETSCVGELIPLKGFINQESYDRLRGIFKHNLDLLNKEVL